jgi:hypothetical protein
MNRQHEEEHRQCGREGDDQAHVEWLPWSMGMTIRLPRQGTMVTVKGNG